MPESLKPLDALNRLVDLATGFCRAQTFFAACNLGVFEALGKQHSTSQALATKLSLHPDATRRLLFALTQLGLIEQNGNLFSNTGLGEYCTSESAVPMSALKVWGNPFYHMWEYLPDAMREYSPRWQQALGTSAEDVFEALYEDPARLRGFTDFLHAWSAPQGQELAERFDFSTVTCVLDVGGGTGALGLAAGTRNPGLRGIVMDVPSVCPIATEYIAKSGLTDRFSAVPGDLFNGASYPKDADAILLGSVLHDWSDDKCRDILRHCYDALPTDGALLVCEKVVTADSDWATFASMMDLWMLVVSAQGARERTESDFRALLEEAGFRDVEVVAMNAPRDLVLARKRSENP
jgi:hypothetical protein